MSELKEQLLPVSTPASTLKRLLEWLELLIKLIVVTGAISAAWQYFDIKQEGRVKEVMERVKIFGNDEKLVLAQMKLQNTWDKQQQNFERLQEVSQDTWTKYVLLTVQQNELQTSINRIVDFFDNLEICIQYKICDRKVSQGFLGDYANNFFLLHKPWIVTQRKFTPNYATYMELFVLSLKSTRKN